MGIVVLAGTAAACGGDDLLVPDSITKVSATDGQSAPAGSKLPLPLAVEVLTSDALPALRAEVRWTVASGSATLSDMLTLADGAGRAQAGLTLGPQVGSVTVRAALNSKPDRFVEFTVVATDPPVISRLIPSQFSGGDTIIIEGTGLGNATAVWFGRIRASVLATNAAAVTAAVPSCLAPGPTPVSLAVGLAISNAVEGSFQALQGLIDLRVGEYMSVSGNEVSGCAMFPASGPDTVEYLVAVQSTTGTPDLTGTYLLSGDSLVTATAVPLRPPAEIPLSLRFHDFLRSMESEIAELPRPHMHPLPVAPQAALRVGDRKNFKVCNRIGCDAADEFSDVTAEAQFVGQRVAIFQDVEAPGNGFTRQEFAVLGLDAEQVLYDVATRSFGAESDVDQNGLVNFLLTPVVNRLTPETQCSQSFISGFFFAIDIDPAFARDERSNQAEVFYAVVPDPLGTVTCTFDRATVRRVTSVTFVHELQHMINFNQHVLLRDGPAEELWLNEGLSHLAEELSGLQFLQNGDSEMFSDLVRGDMFNAFKYLKAPSSFFTITTSGTGSLEERGAAWLFLRWILDTHGSGLARELVETDLTGAANVERVAGEPISTLLSDWFVANYVSDLPGFPTPERLSYTTWDFRTLFLDLHRQSPGEFDRVFPIVPAIQNSGAFQSSGVVKSGSGDYITVIQEGGAPSFALMLSNLSGQPLSSGLDVRMHIIRIR